MSENVLERPEFLSLSQAHKISGLSKSVISNNIKNGLYGDVKTEQQGQRTSYLISTKIFKIECEKNEVELDWTVLERTKNRSRTKKNSSEPEEIVLENNRLEVELKATKEHFEQFKEMATKAEQASQQHLQDLRLQLEKTNQNQQAALLLVGQRDNEVKNLEVKVQHLKALPRPEDLPFMEIVKRKWFKNKDVQ